MITFDDFKNKWLGHRVGDDSLVANHEETEATKYQCVSLIKQYLRECFDIQPGYWGSAIDYWTHTSPTLLARFSRHNDGSISKGDIVILNSTASNPYGHIGVATGNGDPNSVEILEQNGLGSGTGLGQDAIRTRFIPRNHIAGVLRPTPVVAPPVPSGPPYWVEPIPAKQVKTNKSPTMKWGMNYDNAAAMEAHPVAQLGIGTVMTVVAKVHHNNGMTYYRTDMNDPDGWNVLDCDDYTVPPPPPPAPQVIATPNIPVQLAEKYEVVTKLMVFPTAADAKALSNYTETDLQPGSYYVFAKDNNAYNLSTSNVQNQNKWVRVTDNVVSKPAIVETSNITTTNTSNIPTQPTLPVDAPPTDITLPTDPAPVIPAPSFDSLPTTTHPKPQYNWIRQDMEPVRLTSTNSTAVKIADLEGKWPTQDFPAHHTEDYSMFTVVNGTEYWLPDKTRKKGYMYGLSTAFLPDEEPIEPTLFDHNANGRNDIIDLFDNGIAGFVDFGSKYLDGIKRAVTVVAPKIAPARQRLGKTIDGITKKGK